MTIEAGSVIEGTVTKITNFGAFVELGDTGKTGLAHISEVADVYVNNIRDFFTEGDKVTAKVLSVEDNGKIALSLKQSKTRPAQDTGGNFKPRGQQGRGDFRKPGGRLSASFEDKLSKFLKDSDERLTDLKRKTDSKRGGRGSRRSD